MMHASRLAVAVKDRAVAVRVHVEKIRSASRAAMIAHGLPLLRPRPYARHELRVSAA
ncbi:MAG: hypothetical protein ABW156_00995 [Jiangellaceae bacterium]